MKMLLAFLAAAAAVPAAAQAPAAAGASDPARLSLAHGIADRLLPPGSYQKVLQGSMKGLMGSMMGQMMDVPVKQFAGMAGLSDEETRKLGPATTRQIMEIVDPAFEKRVEISMTTLMDGMGGVMTTMEPDMREGLAEAYADRFSAAQLTEVRAFFDTPTGTAFAAQQLTLMSDPALAKRMQALMPTIMKAMPDLIKKVQAATADLPKPKTIAQLSDADRVRLAHLLNVAPEKLKQAKEPK